MITTMTTTTINQRTLGMKESLQQVDFLTRQLLKKYPRNPQVEVETAVLLAVLEAGDIQDRDRIRALAGKLLSDGGIDGACAIAGNYGVDAIARKAAPSGAASPAGRAELLNGCGILA
jgi:hypothetical protein